MRKIDEIITKKYEEYNEEERLFKDNAHELEFITTTHFIEKYLKNDSKILEIGSATGSYSLYYADKGYDVSSVELVEHNIEIFKSKVKNNMSVKIYQGNAVDLSIFEDGQFDVTLCLGPLYHLFNEKDLTNAIKESIRVTKIDGIIFLAYIPSDVVMINWLLRKNRIMDTYNYYDKEFNPKNNNLKECFSVWKMEYFENLMKDYKVKFIQNVGVSGLSIILSEHVNSLTKEEFKIWVDYHLKTCTNTEAMGYNSEIIYICRKEG